MKNNFTFDWKMDCTKFTTQQKENLSKLFKKNFVGSNHLILKPIIEACFFTTHDKCIGWDGIAYFYKSGDKYKIVKYKDFINIVNKLK